MIIAIVNQHGNPDRRVVAHNLAVLRARSGRRVCLMSTDSADWGEQRSLAGVQPWIDTRRVGSRAIKTRLATLRPLFDDILIDAGAHDTQECLCVLDAARLVVVPVRGDGVDPDGQGSLIHRIDAARGFNPRLQVLFVAVTGNRDAQLAPAGAERAAILAQVAQVDGAALAATVLHAPAAFDDGAGRCVCDAETCDPHAAAEMHALYDEIYAPLPLLSKALQSQMGAAHALYR